MESLERPFPAFVTLEKAVETQDSNGAIINAWEPVEGLIALRGTFAAASAREQRRSDLTVETSTHIFDLKSYQPEALTEYRAIVLTAASGASTYTLNINAVKHDSQGTMTRLELELVTT